jgi:hypothetical protein
VGLSLTVTVMGSARGQAGRWHLALMGNCGDAACSASGSARGSTTAPSCAYACLGAAAHACGPRAACSAAGISSFASGSSSAANRRAAATRVGPGRGHACSSASAFAPDRGAASGVDGTARAGRTGVGRTRRAGCGSGGTCCIVGRCAPGSGPSAITLLGTEPRAGIRVGGAAARASRPVGWMERPRTVMGRAER